MTDTTLLIADIERFLLSELPHVDAVRAVLAREGYTPESGMELRPWGGEDVAGHLEAADTILRTDGWCQKAYQDPEGRRCISGALSATVVRGIAGNEDTHTSSGLILEAVLRSRTGNRYEDYLAWNDEPGRTLAEVRELIAHAADVARALGGTAP